MLKKALKTQIVRGLAAFAAGILCSLATAADFPGGFLENPATATARRLLTRTELLNLVPARGSFTFPAPYNTTAVRLTNDADCSGRDCVNHVGYSYWNNINNHVGRDTMLIFVVLKKELGGAGPTLLEYNKLTDTVANRGLLFDDSNPLSWGSGEGWYFSSTRPNALYVNSGPMMYRYDVMTRVAETVFDIRTALGSGHYIWQMHSSADDRVHSATVRSEGTEASLGCVAYREDTRRFNYFPAAGAFDECQVDKSGKWLLIKENVDGKEGEDNRIINLDTLQERLLPDSAGAAGHSDLGFGYMVASDNWADKPNMQKLWKFDAPVLVGAPVYHNTDWTVAAPSHVSHSNARGDLAPEQQYACGSSSNHLNSAEANEIICFNFDGSGKALVVAPVMTNLDALGGGGEYEKTPKGNLDVTGRYFLWSSNLGGPRLDIFLVKVPAQLLTGAATPLPPATPPAPTPIELPDTTPPVQASPSVVSISPTSVRINWSTNEPATNKIQYGIGSNTNKSSTLDRNLVTAHSRQLSSLTPGTKYLYRTVNWDAAGNMTKSAAMSFTTAASPSPVPVIPPAQTVALSWNKPINAVANSGTLTKNAGCDGCPDAGASSIQKIDDGSGYVEFTVGNVNKMLMFGLSKPQTAPVLKSMEFGLSIYPGYAEVRERGVYRADIPVVAGDVLRITVLDGVVRYFVNGKVFHTSKLAPVMPLLTYATLYSSGSSVISAKMSGL